jgi:hypothetical protein
MIEARKKAVSVPSSVVQDLVRPLGYVALAARPADPSGLVGTGLIILALCVRGRFPVGPWVTWWAGKGLYLGHYFDIEESAWSDFWERD